jgi:hypothetical protein
LAPEVDLDSELSPLKSLEAVSLPLKCTVLEWIWIGKNHQTIIKMLVGCALQVHEDLENYRKLLKPAYIGYLWEKLKETFRSHLQMASWEFWDGMNGDNFDNEDGDNSESIDRDSGKSSDDEKEVNMRDLVNLTQPNQQEELGTWHVIATKGQMVNHLMKEKDHQNLLLNTAKSLFKLVQRLVVGTINVDQEDDPQWVITPDIHDKDFGTYWSMSLISLCETQSWSWSLQALFQKMEHNNYKTKHPYHNTLAQEFSTTQFFRVYQGGLPDVGSWCCFWGRVVYALWCQTSTSLATETTGVLYCI